MLAFIPKSNSELHQYIYKRHYRKKTNPLLIQEPMVCRSSKLRSDMYIYVHAKVTCIFISMVVADGLAPYWCQDICSHTSDRVYNEMAPNVIKQAHHVATTAGASVIVVWHLGTLLTPWTMGTLPTCAPCIKRHLAPKCFLCSSNGLSPRIQPSSLPLEKAHCTRSPGPMKYKPALARSEGRIISVLGQCAKDLSRACS